MTTTTQTCKHTPTKQANNNYNNKNPTKQNKQNESKIKLNHPTINCGIRTCNSVL